MYKFWDGLLFFYEKLKFYKEVLVVYMKDYDYKGFILICKCLGEIFCGGDLILWNDVLFYFGDYGENCFDEVREVLVYIECDNLFFFLIVF